MKELGKMLVKNGLPIRRSSHDEKSQQNSNFEQPNPPQPAPYSRLSRRASNPPREEAVPEKVPEIQPQTPGSVYQELDSWRPNARAQQMPDLDPLAELIEGIMPKEEFDALRRSGRKPYNKPKKKRNVCMTMSVSEEEAELLRRYPASLDLTFSEWARAVLFQSMGKKLPKRPGNPKG